MKQKKHPNPASAKEKAEGSRENVNYPREDAQAEKDPTLHGKTDSGPEPDVFPDEEEK